jgi:hypothetical protein
MFFVHCRILLMLSSSLKRGKYNIGFFRMFSPLRLTFEIFLLSINVIPNNLPNKYYPMCFPNHVLPKMKLFSFRAIRI